MPCRKDEEHIKRFAIGLDALRDYAEEAAGQRSARPVQPAPEGRGLPAQGQPGTWVVGPRGDRLYGPDGKPIKDVDWGHNHGQGKPHTHEWIDGKRQDGRPATEEESFSGEGRRDDGLIRPGDWR